MQFGLRSNKFFMLIHCGKLWPRSVAQQVVSHGWNMPESLNNHTSILCLNYLNMHQVLCACACATSRLECKICKEAYQPCAQLASMKKQSLWYVRPKIPMESHTVCHGCKHGGIKTLLVRTVKSKMHNLTSSYSSKSGPRVPSASWM